MREARPPLVRKSGRPVFVPLGGKPATGQDDAGIPAREPDEEPAVTARYRRLFGGFSNAAVEVRETTVAVVVHAGDVVGDTRLAPRSRRRSGSGRRT